MSGYLRLFSSNAAQTTADAISKGVVITGGSRGLGWNLASEFLSRGNAVVITSRTADAAEGAAHSLRTMHGDGSRVYACACDVRDWRQVDALAEFARQHLPSVDMWINNAALSQSAKANIEETDPELLAEIVSTNLLGSMYGARAAIKVMRQQEGGGKVWLVDGTGAWGNPTPGNVAYGAAKRALTQLKASLASETKGSRVSVHIASPGMMATDLLLKAASNARSAKFINILAEPPGNVAKWLVPRMEAAKGNGKYIKYLTPPGVLWRFLTAGRRKNRFLDEAAFAHKAD